MSTCSSCKSYNALKLENAEKDISIGQYQEQEEINQYRQQQIENESTRREDAEE